MRFHEHPTLAVSVVSHALISERSLAEAVESASDFPLGSVRLVHGLKTGAKRKAYEQEKISCLYALSEIIMKLYTVHIGVSLPITIYRALLHS